MASTSLNPLFSEEEIANQRGLSEKWQKKAELYFDDLLRTERGEIEQHQKSGKDKSSFQPSTTLKNLVLRYSVAITGRNIAKAEADQMIEANISILNGKSIAEVSSQFEKSRSRIPWKNMSLDSDAWSNKPEIEEEFKKDLKTRTEFWHESWDFILSKDYLAQEQEDA